MNRRGFLKVISGAVPAVLLSPLAAMTSSPPPIAEHKKPQGADEFDIDVARVAFMAGAITVNECRSKMGLSPVHRPIGDAFYIDGRYRTFHNASLAALA